MSGALPIYQRIKEDLLTRIRAGEFAPGSRVPSENELVEKLKVSRMTVNRALRELTDQGHLDRVPGVGTFVKTPQARASLIEIRNIADEIAERGHTHQAIVIERETAPAKPAIAQQFGLAPGTPLHHILLVHLENGTPVQIEDRHVDEAVAPGFAAQDFTHITPTSWLLATVPVDELEHVVEAVLPTARMATLLKLDKGEPCLALHRRSWRQGRVVTAATFLYPASRHALVSRYRTSPTGTLPQRT